MEAPDMADTEFDLFEIMRTTRSMRRLKTDPVPSALLSRILEAGTLAASGGNMQSWRFLVIRDRTVKEAAGAWYRKAWHEVVAPRYRSSEPAPHTTPEAFARMLAAASQNVGNHRADRATRGYIGHFVGRHRTLGGINPCQSLFRGHVCSCSASIFVVAVDPAA
jgi:nitroreductase